MLTQSLAQIVAQTATAPAFTYTPTPFGFLAAGAFLGFGLGFLWHCIIFAWSPLKWFRDFLK